MATTTTNFGWDIPQSTDLVKDGATAIAALGQDIDTALVDLKGGTTGQVLAKASSADLDFSWSSTTGAGLILISATSCSAVSSQAITAFSSTYTNYRIIYSGDGTVDQSLHMRLRSGSTDSSTGYYYYANRYFSSNTSNSAAVANGVEGFEVGQTFDATSGVIEVYQPFEAERTSVHAIGQNFSTTATRSISVWSSGVHDVSTSYDGFNLRFLGGAFTGTIFVYGYRKAQGIT